MKNKIIIVLIIAIPISYLLGEMHYHNLLSITYMDSRKFFDEIKFYLEMIYFVCASIILPLAYFQYKGSKITEINNAKIKSLDLAREYNKILLLDKKYSSERLKTLKLEESAKGDVLKFNDLLNTIDHFAGNVIHGPADPKTIKMLISKAYCEQIARYLEAIKRISKGDPREGLENLFALYDMWRRDDA